MDPIFELKGLIRQYIAPHRRTEKRLAWLNGLIDLKETLGEFFGWRKNYRYKVRVTSQIFVLNHHLNSMFGSVDILVGNYTGYDLPVGDIDEKSHWKEFGNSEDTEHLVPIALRGENLGTGFSDFYVRIPEALRNQAYRIEAEINKYKLANKTFDTIIVTTK